MYLNWAIFTYSQYFQITKSIYLLALRLYVQFMRKFFLNTLIALTSFIFLSVSYAEDKKSLNTEINLFTGIFDFSDHKQKAGIVGLEHQNDDLYRESFLGKLSPITGGFLTENNAFYLYTGAQAEYELGWFTITPSFTPGYYNSGDGKDLGHAIEFKSEVQMSLNVSENTQFGMSYNHISNASLGDKNPGANSYMINFLKQF